MKRYACILIVLCTSLTLSSVLVVRHAPLINDLEWPCDPNVTEHGYDHAFVLGQKSIGEGYTRILTSPALRGIRTATALSKALNVPIEEHLQLHHPLMSPCKLRSNKWYYHPISFLLGTMSVDHCTDLSPHALNGTVLVVDPPVLNCLLIEWSGDLRWKDYFNVESFVWDNDRLSIHIIKST